MIYRDYHITFFISDPWSAQGPDILTREPICLRADIRTNGWWGIWYEKSDVIIFLSYTWNKKTFPEIDECHTDYGKGYDIIWNRGIYFLYQSAKVISWRYLMHFIKFNFYFTWQKKCVIDYKYDKLFYPILVLFEQ